MQVRQHEKTEGTFTKFSHPLSHEDRQQAMTLLQLRKNCRIGNYRLYANEDLIEADDAYGQPAIWSGDTAADKALQWVDRQYAHEKAEQAEYEAWVSQ
jgi:hypothetical protein